MIVNKPQFDTEAIKPGQPYWLTKKSYNGYTEISAACIIKKVKPLSIDVTYLKKDHNNKSNFMDELVINIEDIVDKKFTLQKMVIE